MTKQYSVAFLQEDADAEVQRVILATLPNRFRVISDHDADILIVPGTRNPESRLDAIGSNTRGLFLSEPGRLSADEFGEIRRRAGSRPIGFGLVVATAVSDGMETYLRDDRSDSPVIVDVAAEVSSSDTDALRAAAFEQLMLLDAVAGRILGMTILARTKSQFVATVEVDSTWRGVRISVRSSFRSRLTLHTVSRSLRRQLTVTPDPHAEPSKVTIFDGTGSRSPLPVYQGGHRRSWLWLHEALSGDRGYEDRVVAVGRALNLLRF